MSKLFQPLKIGDLTLQHRIVMAPLTRLRSTDTHIPLPIVQEYYSQRAVNPGTLLVSEGNLISPRSGGLGNAPGIWSAAQIAEWKPVTTAVHAKGSYIFCQIAGMGRAANAALLNAEGYDVVSASDIPISSEHTTPRPLTVKEIWDHIGDFVQAAKNAIEAGFDGVEIHGANGFLVDQFTQYTANKRTDEWGGSAEKRAKFGLEVVKAVAAAIGAHRIGFRLSPFSEFQGMKMDNPLKEFTPLVMGLKKMKIAYLHLIEARIIGPEDKMETPLNEKLDPFVEIWGDASPVLIAGGFDHDSARNTVDKKLADYDVAVVFGRHFISNPDLVFRLRNGIALQQYDRSTFYKVGSKDGYIDYPYSREFQAQATVQA